MYTPKLTAKQYLKIHPEKYILVTHEFGVPVFIAPINGLSGVNVTNDKQKAQIWGALDNTDTKLSYHKSATGYKGLIWEQTTNN